jgi:hypothetical protein
VASGVDQAQQQRDLTKRQLAADAARLEARVRAELDWRGRLKRDGPRLIALGAAAVVLVGALVVVRSRLRRRKAEEPAAAASLDALAAQLREIRVKLDKKEKSPLWQQALLRGVTAAGAAGGTFAAKRMLEQQTSGGREEAATSGGH